MIVGDKNVGKSRLLSWLLKDMPQSHTQNIFHEVRYDIQDSRWISMTVCELDSDDLADHLGSASGIIFIYDINLPKTKLFVQKLHTKHKKHIQKI